MLIHVFGDNPAWPIAGYAFAQFVAVLIVLPIIRFGFAIGPIDRRIFREALHYGLPLAIGGGLSWVSINASRFIVSDMLGLGAAGLFAVGYSLGWRVANVAAMMVTASAFPLAVSKMEEGGGRLALRQLSDNGALLATVLLPSVAGVFILRDELVHLLIAPAFQSATLAILPLAAVAGAIRNFRAHFADQTFLLHRRTRLMIVVNGIEAAVTVAVSTGFIERWGLLGGVFANAVAALVAAILSFSLGIMVFGLRPPMVHLGKVALATLAMMMMLYTLPKYATAWVLVIHIGLGGAIYAIVLVALCRRTLMTLWDQRAKAALPMADRRV